MANVLVKMCTFVKIAKWESNGFINEWDGGHFFLIECEGQENMKNFSFNIYNVDVFCWLIYFMVLWEFSDVL